MTIPDETTSDRLAVMRIRIAQAIADREHELPVAAVSTRPIGPARQTIGARLIRAVIGAASVATVLFGVFVLGFVWFATWIAHAVPPEDARADGIVVLTGGRDRVSGGVELLEEGRGRRLLISGVHPQTRAEDIQKVTDADRALFACCVDLGHRAETTVGNAREAADWARAHGFSSLIVVTSAYHMPRSLVELDKAAPDVRKIAWPVKRPDLAVEAWFLHPATAKLLLHEYVKYIVTRFGPSASMIRPTEVAAMIGVR
mgnify:CR=1 FL=1